ncbi:ATP-dependent DNA helicase DinG [Cohnella sp. CFH 77786]|uniref:ATP-dependent DNA helicase DinG n=1 Tax=Cohnella sp. CFH 77786 TaxID=2662265 RepID=UPI001C60BF92|nr:ATP-dependent DNA helicase DinG [Cohnella sp. CFH 77786]MBW5446599.1 ATP-dependent DNA helicase DinG [Cohnella sp. CFH 77786]
MKFAVLDFETTGMSEIRDEIIQAGLAVIDEAGTVCSAFASFVRPEKPVPAEITKLTGIRDEDVREAPEIEEVLARMVPYLQDAVLVGHNVEFDARFLQAALDRSGYLPFTGRMLDTVELTRLTFPTLPSYQLSSLTQTFGIGHDRPHQADSDALATAELFTIGLNKLRSLPMLTLQRLNSLFDPERSDLGWLISLTLQDREIRPAADEQGYHYHRQFAMKVGDWSDDAAAAADDAASALAGMTFEAFVENVRRNLKELLPAYEEREGQDIMFGEVLQSLEQDSHLLVEAGTGTGKSLGYLLPSLYYGLRESKKIVVTTHTIQLQEQLRQRDLPLLQQVLPVPFRASVFKGRGNYLCLRKFENRVSVPDFSLGADDAVTRGAMVVWLSETATGEGEELNLGRGRDEWDAVASDAASCLNRSCPWFHKCFYHRARNDTGKADLVITNHALVFTDMRAEHRLLPSYDRLIVDEAHHLEEVAGQHLGQKTGYNSLAMPLGRLWRDARNGLIPQLAGALTSVAHEQAPAWLEKVELMRAKLSEIREAWERWTEALFGLLASQAAADETGNLTLRLKPDALPNGWETIRVDAENAIQLMSDFVRPMEKLAAEIRDETDEYSLQGLLTDLSGVLKDVAEVRAETASFVSLAEPDYVYWAEAHYQYRGRSVWMYGVPADVSGLLKEGLFDRKASVVMTSATLTVDKSFQYVTEQLGLTESEKAGRLRTAVLPSPFRYREQALVLIPRDFPGIRGKDGDTAFVNALADSLRDVAQTVGGRMLVLFTSHRMLKTVYGPLKESLEPAGIQVLGQGIDGSSRSRLTKQFREQPASVLLGTSSFWEGVDLPGDALTCLAIVRLPFQPPNHPVVEAKSEKLQAEKKNPFMKLSLPQAVIRFKQGFGRLVRTATDRGIVILYDTRVLDTSYGKYFLYSLPGPKMEHLPTAGMAARIKQWLDAEQTDEGGEAG